MEETKAKNTIIVNLFGPPGTGKSTGAAYIFSKLKMAGIDCELVTEYAKDKVWEHNEEVFKNQIYIFGKQSFALSRCNGKVDVIVTDSPLPLSILYADEKFVGKHYKDVVMSVYNNFSNVNFLLKRVKAYNPNGRLQTEEESNMLGEEIKKILDEENIKYNEVNGSIDGYEYIATQIIAKILNNKKFE